MKYNTVIMMSGGVDSLAAYALRPGTAASPTGLVFVDIGQGYASKEFLAVRKIAKLLGAPLEKVRAGWLAQFEVEPTGIIPHRNALLALWGAQYAPEVIMGVLQGEINSDKSPEFMQAMQQVLDISRRPQYWTSGVQHTLHSNLRHMTKTQAVAMLLHRGYGEALRHTVSCYDGGDQHCGHCPSCFKRWVAFTNNGLPTDHFLDAPPLWAATNGIIDKCHDGTYEPARANEILEAMQHAGVSSR